MKKMEYMQYIENKKALEDMLNLVLSGEWTLPKFKDNFYSFYLEEVPDEILSEDEYLLYSTIIEGLDRTDWTNQQLINWIWNQRQSFLEAITQTSINNC